MKKFCLSLILLSLSIMLAFFSYDLVFAKESNYTTIYPNNILDYTNLTNISSFDINDNYICYTTDKSSIILFEKSTKNYTTFNGLSNISKIKLYNNNIIVADNNSIKVIKEMTNITTLNDISLDGIKALDIYTTQDNILIATANSSTFKLFKYDNNFNSISNNPVLKISPIDSNFNNVFMMAINENNAYLVYKIIESANTYTTGLFKISLNLATNNIQKIDTFQVNAKIIDTFIYNGQEYVTTFTNEILYLLSTENSILANINISAIGNLNSQTFPIFKVTELQFFNNKIYLSDTEYKTIQAVSINNLSEGLELKSDEIILGSFGFDYGRFNNVNDIFIQGNTYITCDNGNNRIHILKNNSSIFIDDLPPSCNPHSLTLDSNQNIYFALTKDSREYVYKYKYSNNEYLFEMSYDKFNNQNFGYISSICCNQNNLVFMIDSTNNCIIYLSENSPVKLTNSTLQTINFESNSQIKYLKENKMFIISANNNIYLMSSDGNILSSTNVPDLKEITVDTNKIYAITNSNISIITTNNNTLQIDNTILNDCSDYSNFSYDIISRKMIAFQNSRSCLISFDFETNINVFNFEDISNTQALNSSSTLIPFNINNALIYEYPYELGNIYNENNSIKNCFAIDEFDNYYRILFNYQEELKFGFVNKQYVTRVNYEYNPIDVITTNQLVPIYKYPTLLKYNGQRIVTNNIPINQAITVIYKYPISIDGKTFYTYQKNNEIGFIFNADIVLSENKTIRNLNTENASIYLIGKDTTEMLSSDLQTKIMNLNNDDRVYVQEYNKNEKYTKVIIKDSNLNTIEGYILTTDIKMDKLDNSKVILIVVIVVSIILLATIIVTYIIIKKKNKN